MIISPQHAIDNGYIKFPDGLNVSDHLQQGGIDITLDLMYEYDGSSFLISPNKTQHRTTNQMFPSEPVMVDSVSTDLFYELAPRTSYDFLSNFEIFVPARMSALIIVRSSLNRNGLFVTTGVYDSGFAGNIGGAIHNNAKGYSYIAPGTRIAQVLFVETDNVKMYDGQYQSMFIGDGK